MRTAYKVAIVLFSTLVALGSIVNIPMFPTGMLVAKCSHPTSCVAVNTYQTFLQQRCIFSECGGVLTATSAYIFLTSGTASSSSQRGSASLIVGILNPGSETTISMILVSSSWPSRGLNSSNSMAVYQCSSAIACNFPSSPILAARSVTNFNTTQSAFYFGSSITSGTSYYYAIELADGQSMAGQLTAGTAF